MYAEDELLPISALQHLVFCPRQCALIHIEQLWSENVFTAEGRGLHEKVHESEAESRPGVRIVRGLRLRSLALGLVGQADVVEFHRLSGVEEQRQIAAVVPEGLPRNDMADGAGAAVPGLPGRWRVFPVEYKRGKPKLDVCDEVQLCAQALCLEEMLGTSIANGALFYGRPRRRQEVEFTETLRQQTRETAGKLHELLRSGQTPKAAYAKKCESCSLLERCLPKITGIKKNIRHYLSQAGTDE
ncbi:MAG: CRISPR-associated protein Cas4 [Planctomycetes bacterium]|nr:CRISPR-associated protein Cas4 [Planctomycetota bacterium]